MNWVRLRWGIFYFVFGILALLLFCIGKVPEFREFLKVYFFNISWCVSWSAVGIAAGLWSSLKDDSVPARSNSHYITYFVFVLFIASLAAFVAFLYVSNNNLLAFAFSALVAIVTGFSGDRLAGNILNAVHR